MGHKLLIIDDDVADCALMGALFTPAGFEVIIAHDGPQGVARIADDRPDVVVLDLELRGLNGIEVLERVLKSNPNLPMVMITGTGGVRTAVRAIQLGAAGYLTKPFDNDEIMAVIRRALATRVLQLEVEQLRRELEEAGLPAQMGSSPAVQALVEQVRDVARSNFSVLILGETGTGKELIARALHEGSDRRSKALIALDCGAIPEALLESQLFGHEKGAFSGADRRREGQFRLAEGGTFFLDEIGNLPLLLQAKLLRVLETHEVSAVGSSEALPLDVRFIAATNLDLQARVRDGAFRADLYFRLAQFTLTMPALRERPSDIAYLAQRFLSEASIELRKPVQSITDDAQDLLLQHAWPGNVRELRNVIRQAVLGAKGLALQPEALLPLLGKPVVTATPERAPVLAGRSLKEVADTAAAAAERTVIAQTLQLTHGNKSRAAKALRTDYKTLHLKMKRLGMHAGDYVL